MAIKIEIDVEDNLQRIVRLSGTSGRINVSKDWIGRKVMVCLLPEEVQQT